MIYFFYSKCTVPDLLGLRFSIWKSWIATPIKRMCTANYSMSHNVGKFSYFYSNACFSLNTALSFKLTHNQIISFLKKSYLIKTEIILIVQFFIENIFCDRKSNILNLIRFIFGLPIIHEYVAKKALLVRIYLWIPVYSLYSVLIHSEKYFTGIKYSQLFQANRLF